MTQILLTGATGYLGGYLSEYFISSGYELVALCLNKNEKYKFFAEKGVKTYFLDETDIEDIFKENNVDIIVHTATLYGRTDETLANMIQANEIFPIEILTTGIKYKVKAIINTDTSLQKKVSYYSLTKSHFLDWLEMFSDKILCANLKLDQFYGPHDKPTKFIAWLIEQFKQNKESIDLTEGLQYRDFIYVTDVVQAFGCLINNLQKLKIGKVNKFEVGTNKKTTVREMVTMLKSIMNNNTTRLNFGALPYRKNDALDYDMNTKTLRALGWNPEVFLEDGLKKVVLAESENV